MIRDKNAVCATKRLAVGLGDALGASSLSLLDLVYPPHCVICGASCSGDICGACEETLERVDGNTCGKCGHQLAEVTRRSPRCPSCTNRTLFFATAVAPCRYDGSVREMILKFKLGKRRFFARPLARMLIERIENEGIGGEVDAVVPVPLHWMRSVSRGFNQARLLAEAAAKHLDIPLVNRSLKRIRATKSQTKVSGAVRQRQLRGAFRVRRPRDVAGRCILLIDDVMTTCATAAECSRTLIHAGAAKVLVATVARTMAVRPEVTREMSL